MRFRARSFLDRSYLGEEISAERQADEIGSNFNDTLILKYRGAYSAVQRLMPSERTKLWNALQAHIARLPPSERGTVIALYNQQKGKLDLRTPTGLGVTGAIGTIANIAALVATLGTLGLGVASFVEQRKEGKAAAAERSRIAAQEEAALRLQIDEQRARIERDRIAFEEQRAALRARQQPTRSTTTIAPDGSLVMEPAPTSKTPVLVGAGLAIAAGLALVK